MNLLPEKLTFRQEDFLFIEGLCKGLGSREIQRWRQRSGLSRSKQRPRCKGPNRHEDRDRPPRSSCFRRHMDLSYFRSRPKGTRTRDTNTPSLRQIPQRQPTTWVFAALVAIESSLIMALVLGLLDCWGKIMRCTRCIERKVNRRRITDTANSATMARTPSAKMIPNISLSESLTSHL